MAMINAPMHDCASVNCNDRFICWPSAGINDRFFREVNQLPDRGFLLTTAESHHLGPTVHAHFPEPPPRFARSPLQIRR